MFWELIGAQEKKPGAEILDIFIFVVSWHNNKIRTENQHLVNHICKEWIDT